MKLYSGTQKSMGEMLPAWYYGYSYRKWDQDVIVFHIIPLNYIIRWCLYISYAWNKFRSTPGRVDRIIEKEIRKTFK